MSEETSFFYKETISDSSTTLLKQSQQALVLDPIHSEIELHDDENFRHLALSYIQNTLSFQMLSTAKFLGDSVKSLCIEQIIIPQNIRQIIQTNCSNLHIKQLKMVRIDQSQENPDDIFDEGNSEPESPQFAKSPPKSQKICSQNYIATLILEFEIIVVSFTIVTIKNKIIFTHTIESMNVNNIKFDGKIIDAFLNKEREQIIVQLNYPESSKIQLIDKILSNHISKDIAQYPIDSEKIIGSIGVSPEFSLIRVFTKSEKDSKRFYISTIYINNFGIQGTPNNSELLLKINITKKPLTGLMNDSNHKSCQTLFSQSSSYLVISDGSNIEIQDFNNNSAKNVLKEYISPHYKSNNKENNPSRPQKQIYNLDKSTLLISNSSVNQSICIYNFDNPISILEQINSLCPESVSIKNVIISQSSQKNSSPSSATNLMEMYSNIKTSINGNLILVVAILDDQANTAVPFIVNKENLDLKVPELKFVSSQISNYYNYDDSQNFFNEIDNSFPKASKNFDVFKTPDRKASFNLLNSSLESNKFHFSSNNFPFTLNSQQNNLNSTIYPNLRQGKCLNFDNFVCNTQKERERSMSQESNSSSRNFSAYKPTIYGPYLNNRKTLFNENSNSICIEDIIQQIQKTTSGKKEKEYQQNLTLDPSLFDKISPTQQKIDEAINSSDSEESNSNKKPPKNKIDNFDLQSPLSTQSKNQNRYVGRNNTNKGKDFSRITMKKQSNFDTIPQQLIQKAEVSQEDIIESFSEHSNQNSNGFIAVYSQTQEDIENTFSNNNNNNSYGGEPNITFQEDFLKIINDSSKSTTSFAYSKNQKSKSKNNSIINLNYNNECDQEDITNIQSQEMGFNQSELESTVSSKKTVSKRNNLFNKQTSNPNTATSRVKSKQVSSNQKNITSFLTASPCNKQFMGEYQSQQKNICNNKPLNSSTSSSSSSNKSSSSTVSEIKPFNMYTQSLFLNEQQKSSKSNQIPLQTINKHYLDEKSYFQLPLFGTNASQNRNKQQPTQQQQQNNFDFQSLLGKRKPQPQQQIPCFGGSNLQDNPRKIYHKQE